MSEESKMKEVNKRWRKTRNKINNANKNILGIVNEVIRERPTNESHVQSNSFLEALNEQEADIIKLKPVSRRFITWQWRRIKWRNGKFVCF